VRKDSLARFSLLFLLLILPASTTPLPARYRARTGAQQQPPTADASKEAGAAYEREFEAVWKAVRDRFYDEKTRGLDWNAVGERYRARLSEARDDRTFAALANAMLGELRASHTRLFTADDFEFYLLPTLFGNERPAAGGRRPTLRHIGAMTRADAPGVVAAVLNGSPAYLTGLQPGDVLVCVSPPRR